MSLVITFWTAANAAIGGAEEKNLVGERLQKHLSLENTRQAYQGLNSVLTKLVLVKLKTNWNPKKPQGGMESLRKF